MTNEGEDTCWPGELIGPKAMMSGGAGFRIQWPGCQGLSGRNKEGRRDGVCAWWPANLAGENKTVIIDDPSTRKVENIYIYIYIGWWFFIRLMSYNMGVSVVHAETKFVTYGLNCVSPIIIRL
ncbi:MAG: hypothetical protein U9N48_01485 [Euryarchaeota archaeon]|nr:hypothetical protein [Euryarchaeota archaeon]